MTNPHTDEIRNLLRDATSNAPRPHPWADVEQRARHHDDPPLPASADTSDVRSHSGHRLLLIAAVIVFTIAGVIGLVALEARDEDPLQPVDTGVVTVPVTTSTPTPTTGPPDALIPPESTERPETETADPGSVQPPDLQRPVPGQTQRSIVGDITWTLIEGDASNVPQGPVVGVDGGYLGGVHDGRTWRSSDGLDWDLVDLGADGVADESVYGEFDFRGETWARTNNGLARWDGETFVPVALPASPFVDLDGLRYGGRFVGAPVVLGDELVVPATSLLFLPWDELFFDGARAEWTGDPQSIRIVDTNPMDGPLPVVAILSAEFIDGEPGRFEFRDVESNELVTTVGAISGVDPSEFLPRIIDGLHREILIGDGDGFEAVEPPGGWGVPASPTGDIAPIDGGVLGIAQQGYRTLTSGGDELGADAWELWTSSDARSWTRLELPTPAGSLIDIVELASNGSTATLTVYSRDRGSQQSVELWATVDGRRWQEIDIGDVTSSANSSRPEPRSVIPTDFGWLVVYDDFDIAVSPDGQTWQKVRFEFPEFQGGGAWAVDRSIFVTRQEAAEETDGSTHSMWVGRVADG